MLFTKRQASWHSSIRKWAVTASHTNIQLQFKSLAHMCALLLTLLQLAECEAHGTRMLERVRPLLSAFRQYRDVLVALCSAQAGLTGAFADFFTSPEAAHAAGGAAQQGHCSLTSTYKGVARTCMRALSRAGHDLDIHESCPEVT